MKFIDEKGRVFNKINILDLLFILVVVLLVFLAILKVTGSDLEDLGASNELVDVEFTLRIPEDDGYLNVIKEGDQLAETKQFLEGFVESVEIEPMVVTNLDENGNSVESIDPTQELGRVTVKATVPYEDLSYKLGAQELREGKFIFLETQFYKYRSQIESVKVVD